MRLEARRLKVLGHELLSEDLRGCSKDLDEVEAGRLQVFEAGRRALARILEAVS